MFSRGLVLILLMQVCMTEHLRADLKEIKPTFERFVAYFDSMQPRHQGVKDDKMVTTIESVINVSGISPVQKQKLLFKLAQIHLQKTEVQHRDLIRAANALRRVLKIRGSRKLARRATLQLALTLSRLGNDNALFYYRKLSQQANNNHIIPYVHLARAEHLFAAGKYRQAKKYYKKVLAYRKHDAYPFAIYKIAWNYLYLHSRTRQHLPRAINAFKKAITTTHDSSDEHLLDLHEDAMYDLAHVWSETRDINAAQKFFTVLGRKDAWHFTMRRTAQLYLKRKQKAKAVAVYKRLLKATALLPEAPDHMQKLLALLYASGKHQQLVTFIQKIPDNFVRKSSTWYLRNRNQARTSHRIAKLNETIWKYARHLYELGTDPRYHDARKQARSIIQVYLKTFPDSKNYLQARFLLAEILYEFNYFERSAQHYLAISNRGDRQEALTKIAALHAIKSMKKLLTATDEFTKSESASIKLKYKQAVDNYLHLFSEEAEARQLLLVAANMELKLKNIERAKQRLQTLLETFTDGKEAEQAVRIMLKLQIDDKNWRTIIAWIDANRKLQASMTDQAIKMLASAYRKANYSLAQQLQEEKQHQAAAKQFMHYQNLFEEDKLADKALFLAGENFYLAGENDAAINSHNILVESYPQSKFSQEALLTLARTHEKAGLFVLAARYYYTFGTQFTKSKHSYLALARAMRYYFYQGMLHESLQAADYIRKKITVNLSQDFYVTLAMVHIKAGNHDEAWRIYKHLLASPHLPTVKFDLDFFGVLYDNGHDKRLLYAINKLQAHADTFRDLISALRFKLLLKPLHEFLVIAIDDSVHVDTIVQQKQQKLLRLVADFEKIIKMGDPVWQTASFYKLGEMHENFATMIFNAPKLVGASQQEVDSYRTRMEKAAFPLRNEAYKYYYAAWQKAQQGNIFTAWMLKSYDKITSMYPDKYPRINEKINTPLYLTHKINLSDNTGILLR